MNKIIITGICVFAISIASPISVFATSYNYLPPDVYIKQQEEKSALEYRLKKLESSFSGSSASYISTLSSRISQLESEKNTEKTYITGVYGNYGITNQLESKLAEIDNKYALQISDLQSQKQEHENKLENQKAKEAEISELKSQIAQLQKTISEQESKAIENPAPVVTKKIHTDADITKIFSYIDSLSLIDASTVYQKINKENPEVMDRVMLLYDKKYPHGKSGTAANDEYLESIQNVTTPIKTTPKNTKVILFAKSKVVNQKIEAAQAQAVTEIVTPTEKAVPQPIQEKQTFIKKIRNFFGKLFSWNN
jgi:hypothetical protein